MPRKPRIDYPGALQHVIARGIEKKNIFENSKDKGRFRKTLSFLLKESSIICYSWCIMDNHFHLLLRTGKTSLSEFMSRILTSYAVYYNKVHKRSGHLFQNRYKSIVCDKDEYLLSLIRYIHLNPVKAKIVNIDELGKYIWCGHRDLLERRSDILEREEILSFFGEKEKEAEQSYIEFLRKGLEGQEDYDGGGLNRSRCVLNTKFKKDKKELFDDRVLGRGNFVKEVLENIDKEDKEDKELSDIKNIEELLEKLINYYNVNREEILNSKVHRVRDPRSLFVYIGNVYLKKSLTELGRLLNISHVAAGKLKLKGERVLAKKDFEFV